MQKINSCLWFNSQALEAAEFYHGLFKNSHIGQILHYDKSSAEISGQKEGSILTVDFEINGHRIIGLNGGPLFKFTPAMSFTVRCETAAEIDKLWQELSKGGEVRMEMGKYPWSEKYGWVADRFGVEWQLMLFEKALFAPSFLFVREVFGKGEEAMNFYCSLFKDSKIKTLVHADDKKSVLHAEFSLAGQDFILSEGPGDDHKFTFTNAFSLVINCETQEEIDRFWNKLSQGGVIEECGWLKDRFGVSWQVVPTVLDRMLSDADKVRAQRVMKAMLGMKKLDIAELEKAYAEE